MLALTATAVATLARTSASDALSANQAERDLQTRWAEVSCRRVLMPAMQERLASGLEQWKSGDLSVAVEQPPATMTSVFKLNGVRVVARMDDQQALPNLNHLLRTQVDGQTPDPRRVLSQVGLRGQLTPQPLDEETTRQTGLPAYTSWGQFYPQTPPEVISGLQPNRQWSPGITIGGRADAGVPLTLWGDGRLNVWTASPQALRQHLEGRIGREHIADLLSYRSQYRGYSSRQLVQMLNLPPDERAAAQGALSDRSRVYGMWLAVTPVQPGHQKVHASQRTAWSLTVTGTRGAAPARPLFFHW